MHFIGDQDRPFWEATRSKVPSRINHGDDHILVVESSLRVVASATNANTRQMLSDGVNPLVL